tara:strand:+ start:63 stop:749 length:687 start_codon:yes stop_codon:yes gene_type:complete
MIKTKIKIVDLSLPVFPNMPKHPAAYLTGVKLDTLANHEKHKRSIQSLTISTHVSTHIDAPFHTIPNGATVDQIPLEKLCGEAKVIHINNKDYFNPINENDLIGFTNELNSFKKIIFKTDWADKKWGTEDYFIKGPFFTRDASSFLVNFDLDMLAIDFPNVDSPEDTKAGTQNPNHAILLSQNIILLENIINLNNLPSNQGKIYCLPIKLLKADGCPCRVIMEFIDEN